MDDVIQQSLLTVRDRVANAARLAQRLPESIQLIAVSKTHPADRVAAAYACGQNAFGENYPQEGVEKIQALAAYRAHMVWHFIGTLQSNKTAVVASHFDWVHSVDRMKIAQRLSDQRPVTLPALQVCVHVNISDETSKSGVAPAALIPLILYVARLPRVCLRGLMAIPSPNRSDQHAPFAQLRQLLVRCNQILTENNLPVMDTLSMGMSSDLEAAISEGATMVRVGSAIFGMRTPAKDAS
ncbi:MAG: YggS family pyridoxal phosphate-dependent enzyme [Ottowia sp.]|nr:YggS family pyridoxal phosphate-dependent enzyme [Ottowia sp.]